MTTQEAVEADYAAIMGEIRAEMARRRMSGQELAQRCGMQQSTMSRRLNGSPFTVRELLAVCRALGLTLTGLASEARKHSAPIPAMREGGASVAGAGFEPATSGTRAALADVVPLLPRQRGGSTRYDDPLTEGATVIAFPTVRSRTA